MDAKHDTASREVSSTRETIRETVDSRLSSPWLAAPPPPAMAPCLVLLPFPFHNFGLERGRGGIRRYSVGEEYGTWGATATRLQAVRGGTVGSREGEYTMGVTGHRLVQYGGSNIESKQYVSHLAGLHLRLGGYSASGNKEAG